MHARQRMYLFGLSMALATGCAAIAGLEDRPLDVASDASLEAPDASLTDAARCSAEQSLCAEKCRDLLVDRANCGACGKACNAGEVCSAGQCGVTCQPSLSLCAPTDAGGADASSADAASSAPGAYCANFATDNANCGGCGVTCAAGAACSAGQCRLTCQSGLSICSKAIADAGAQDASTDAASSDAASSDAAAEGGAQDGGVLASTYCANLASDDSNCGACGVTCGAALHCSSGSCTNGCGNLSLCAAPDGGSPFCADTTTDSNNCGGCGKTCTVTQFCSNKTCLSKTLTYNIALAQLDNQGTNCGTGNYYNGCAGAFGFHWTDTGGGSVKSLTIQTNYGVDCAAQIMPVTLNGAVIGSVASSNAHCTCALYTNLVTVPVSSVASYKVGGANALSFTSPSNCQGLGTNAGWGGAFAQVTVTYQ